MKKFITVVALLALVAGSAFAGVTTVTKLQSQANYPGVLVPGSVSGAQTFITDISLMSNVALFEYVGDAYGLTVLKTDLGTFALSASPALGGSDNMIGLQYATGLEGMDVAAGILYGVENNGYEAVDNSEIDGNNDVTSYYDQYLGLTLGLALKGDLALDLSLNFGMGSGQDLEKDLNADKSLNETRTNVYSDMNIGAAARAGLGDGLSAVLGVNFEMNSSSDKTKVEATNIEDENIYEDSYLTLAALVGKDIKATESLTVKMASGVIVELDTVGMHTYKTTGVTTTYALGDTDTDMYVSIPLNFAVEGKLNETWTINSGVSAEIAASRASSVKFLEDADSKSLTEDRKDGYFNIDPNVGYAIGVTGKIGDLQLDLNINPYFLLSGPEFISGNTGMNLNSDIAVVYSWK
ncbi:MAG: hypothetical protein JXR81_02125 [Candidatus Goldbacteria bacterium]|nr:hypothetical protein [Candidatus Goldiibacteriota bacterium]